MHENPLISQFVDRIMDGYYKQHPHGRDLAKIDLEEVITYTIQSDFEPVVDDLIQSIVSLQEAIEKLKEIQ